MTLKQIMHDHHLRPEHVAILLGVSVSTVHSWLYGRRNMPARNLELLQLKLNAADTGDK